jgi:hypothetical protein
MSFEPFLADEAAEVVCFTLVGYLELRCVFVQNCSAHWVSVHSLFLSSGMNLLSAYLFLMVMDWGFGVVCVRGCVVCVGCLCVCLYGLFIRCAGSLGVLPIRFEVVVLWGFLLVVVKPLRYVVVLNPLNALLSVT